MATMRLEEARNADDDWTGKASAKERRKLQNRLHQRAWRRRKIEEAVRSSQTKSQELDPSLETAFARASKTFLPQNVIKRQPESVKDSWPGATSTTFLSITHANLNKPSLLWPSPSAPRIPKLFSPVLPFPDPSIYVPHVISTHLSFESPFNPSLFPLSPDHYLITLIQYNTLRGIMTNLILIQLNLPLECQQALRLPLVHHPPATPPPTFAHTALQQNVPHEPWIDSVPCPQLRDTLIRAAGTFDDEDLCDDMCGGLYNGFDDVESRGLLVWGDPWLVSSWEISEGFMKKWAFLLRGCGDMVKCTNKWRESTGEEPLVVEL